jgi:tartrate dehydrogenase/decarboxylase/D-malate dehydrogenase
MYCEGIRPAFSLRISSPGGQKANQTKRGSSMKNYKIAVIPGDGIGKEVVPEGIRAMEAAGRQFGFSFSWQTFDWSCEIYLRTGRMMPADGLEQLRPFEAIFLGAVGHPKVPDHVSLWGLLIPIRREFHQYANVRPVRLLPGIEPAVKNFSPGQIDFVVVRENNEGEYSDIGGRIYSHTEDEVGFYA